MFMKEYSREEKFDIISKINKMQREIRKFKQEKNMQPSIEELAKIMNISVEEINELNEIIEELEKEDDIIERIEVKENKYKKYFSTNILDISKDYEDFNILKEKIIANQEILSIKERQVIFLRFGINSRKNWTIDEISKELDMADYRVKAIISRALHKVDRS